MKLAKHFTPGAPVEVQREPGIEWEPAQYVGCTSVEGSRENYHGVLLPLGREREVERADGERVLTRNLEVPSRRIRRGNK